MTEQWWPDGKPVYGLPGRDIKFDESFGDAVHRDLDEEFGRSVQVSAYRIIAVNENFALGNHFVGIAVVADIEGDIDGDRPVHPEDWVRWEWVDLDALPDLFPSAAKAIACYKEGKISVGS